MTNPSSVSIALASSLDDEVGAIAAVLDRPKSWVVEQALRDFVSVQRWQLAAIDEGIKQAEAGQLIPHKDVMAWVRSWDTADELPIPECR